MVGSEGESKGPKEFDKMQIFIQSIWSQVQSNSIKLDQLHADVAAKADLNRLADVVQDNRKHIETLLEDGRKARTIQDHQITNLKHISENQQKFISNWTNGLKWLIRAIVASVFSLTLSIGLAYYQNMHARSEISKPVPIVSR
jgi:hypothetical protein